VVGPSGSGKSSVVKAGLVPALRRGEIPGSDRWFIAEMLPGTHPLDELEIGLLRIAARQPAGLMEHLQRDERGLLRASRLVLPTDDSELLLIVDQFEELFTWTADRAETEHFLRNLVAAVTDPRSRVRVIITLRADFYDRPLAQPGFSELMRRRTEVVVPLTADELARAVREPAEQAGAELEPGLVAAIVADVSEQPGALPMLQYALTELFERREGRLLTLSAYRAIGGVSGALVRRAEEAYSGLDEAGQRAARQLFLRLVTLGEGVEDTQRRVLQGELTAMDVDQQAMEAVIEAFGQARLLSFDRDPATRAPTVEIAHEALLRQWKRLSTWLDESRADVRMQRLLATAVQEWIEAGNDPGFLLRETRLAQFEGWAAESPVALTQDEHAFLGACIADRQARQAEEAARQRRELETARRLAETERRRAEEQAHATRRLRRRAVFLTGALLVAGLLALVALALGRQATRNAITARAEAASRATAEAIAVRERTAAEAQARIATSRELAMAALGNLEVDPERSILLALRAVEETYAFDRTILPEAEDALHQAVGASRLRLALAGEEDLIFFVAFSPDGTRLLTWGMADWSALPGTTRVWDATTGEGMLAFPGIRGADFWPDGDRLATVSFGETGMAHTIWDARTGRPLSEVNLPLAAPPTDGTYSRDWRQAVQGLQNGTTEVWSLETGQKVITLGTEGGSPNWCFAFSPDGERLAAGNEDGTVRVWSLADGETLLTLPGHSSLVRDVTFSPDGRLLITAGGEGAKVWDAETGDLLFTLSGHTNEVMAVALSANGSLLATASWDQTVKVWDLAATVKTGAERELMTLAGHTSAVQSVSFSPDGTRLASAGWDGTVRVWDISPEGTAEGHVFVNGTAPGPAYAATLALSPDGSYLAAANSDETPRVWNTATGKLLRTLSGHTDRVEVVAVSPDGATVATAGHDDTIRLWDAASGESLLTITGFECGKYEIASCDVAFSPDGRFLAAGDAAGTVTIFELHTGPEAVERLRIAAHPDAIFAVAYSPDGTRLATGGWDNTAQVWDAGTGRRLLTLSGHDAPVYGVAYSPDGRRIATTSQDTTVRLWDAGSGQGVATLVGHTSSVFRAAFSPDGARLATASYDGTAKLWDVETGRNLLTLHGHASGVTDVGFSPDGARLYTASADGTDRVYVLDVETMVALARSRVTRSLTDAECWQFLHVDPCPSAPGK